VKVPVLDCSPTQQPCSCRSDSRLSPAPRRFFGLRFAPTHPAFSGYGDGQRRSLIWSPESPFCFPLKIRPLWRSRVVQVTLAACGGAGVCAGAAEAAAAEAPDCCVISKEFKSAARPGRSRSRNQLSALNSNDWRGRYFEPGRTDTNRRNSQWMLVKTFLTKYGVAAQRRGHCRSQRLRVPEAAPTGHSSNRILQLPLALAFLNP